MNVRELKNSRSGYLSQLSRLYGEAEKLMYDNKYHEVRTIQFTIVDQFDRLQRAHKTYVQHIHDPGELDKAEEAMSRDGHGFDEMMSRIEEYLVSPKRSMMDDQYMWDKVSVASSRASTSSTKLKEAQIKEKLATLKLKQLEEQLELERSMEEEKYKLQRAIEEQERIIKVKKREFENKAALKRQMDELEQSQMETALWEQELNDEEVSIRHSKLNSVQGNINKEGSPSEAAGLRREIKSEHVGNTSRPAVRPKDDDHHQYNDRLPQAIKYQDYGYTPNDAHRPRMARSPTTHDRMLDHYGEGIYLATTLPKPELLQFSGDAKDYFRFITNFEVNLGSQLSDNRLKLSYLIQYCKGEAKSVIENCVLLDPEVGYDQACELLKERYGKPHTIARSYIDGLTRGPILKPNDISALIRLAQDMAQCQLTLSKLGYVSDLHSTETLQNIVKRLPNHVRSKWVETAACIVEEGREPNFGDLCNFVKGRARVVSTVYGQEFAQDNKFKPQIKKPNPNSKVNTLLTKTENEHQTNEKVSKS